MIILITGTPCVGKSTVGKFLAEKIGAQILDIKKLAKKGGFVETKNNVVFVDETKINEVVKKEIADGKKYVVPSHLAQYISPEIVDYCFVLRCNPKILNERLEKRDYTAEKIQENILCEILDSCLIESLELGHRKHLYEIDVTSKKPEEVVNEILKMLKNKFKPFFGDVSWTDTNMLKKF